jgi:hypothetical protein
MAKYVVDTVYDGGALCAFDPKALPPDFDALRGDAFEAALLELENQGRLWTYRQASDGGYFCHIYVDQKANLELKLHEHIEFQTDFMDFQCPSGRIWFCGVDYAALDPVSGRPNQQFLPREKEFFAQSIKIKKGNYKMRVTLLDAYIPENDPSRPWTLGDLAFKALFSLLFFCSILFMVSVFHLALVAFDWAKYFVLHISENCCAPSFIELKMKTILVCTTLLTSAIVLYFGIKARNAKETKRRLIEGDPADLPDFIFEMETA